MRCVARKNSIQTEMETAMKMKQAFIQGVALAVTAFSMVVTPLSSEAADRTLRVAYIIGEKHPLVPGGINVLMDKVKAADPSISFRVFPAGQLGKAADTITMLQKGIADITLVVVPYHRQELPMSQAINLPWGAGPWDLTNTFARALQEPGAIHEEWKKNGLVPLMGASNPPYEIHTRNKPIPGLASMRGLKIRSPGGTYNGVLEAMGAVPVSIPTTESFDALQRGTIDATVYAFSNWAGLRYQEVLNQTTVNLNLPAPSGLVFAMSQKVFDSLTPNQKTLFLDAGRDASISAQSLLLKQNEEALEKYIKNGLKTYRWSSEDVAKLNNDLAGIRTDWVKREDAAGRPGTATVEQLSRLLKDVAKDPKNLPQPKGM